MWNFSQKKTQALKKMFGLDRALCELCIIFGPGLGFFHNIFLDRAGLEDKFDGPERAENFRHSQGHLIINRIIRRRKKVKNIHKVLIHHENNTRRKHIDFA